MKSVSIVITEECPARCPHCYFRPPRLPGPDTASLLATIQDLSRFGTEEITFTGGEPTLRDDLEDLITKASERGMRTGLLTSGAGLTRARVEGLAAAGLKGASVTVYSREKAIHEAITGLDGSHGSAIEAIRAFIHSGIPVAIRTPVMRLNLDEMEGLIGLCGELGVELEAYMDLDPPRGVSFATLELPPAEKMALMEKFGELFSRSDEIAASADLCLNPAREERLSAGRVDTKTGERGSFHP